MKASVAITLIVMGTLILLAPAVSDYLHQRQAVRLLEHPDVETVRLEGRMGRTDRLGCWAAGLAMIACGTICSLAAGRRKSKADRLLD